MKLKEISRDAAGMFSFELPEDGGDFHVRLPGLGEINPHEERRIAGRHEVRWPGFDWEPANEFNSWIL